MEVLTEDAHTVLLEGMEGTQYITIQRTDDETLEKGVPLFTLNGTELISEGMVVDMINGVNTDYNSAQYYENDILNGQLTEEDRDLAAALVAVQLQHKQQQLNTQFQAGEHSLADVAELDDLSPVNSYPLQTGHNQNSSPVYPTLQIFKKDQNLKNEYIVKNENDIDISTESSEDAMPMVGQKRTLPHKKRIPQKLKQQNRKNLKKKGSMCNSEENLTTDDTNFKILSNSFQCEICRVNFNGQLKFFEHLKSHYEPMKEINLTEELDKCNEISVNVSNTIVQENELQIQNSQTQQIEEFSEPEDFMEGIRSVVEETGAQIDDDSETENIPEASQGPTIWTISEMSTVQPDQLQSEIVETSASVEENFEEDKSKVITRKKKDPTKTIKTNGEELNCPHCERTFLHKNSLVYHLRSHSGERPHQCEICGKSFLAASALKVHRRLHSGDKPYKCEECGRHFRQWGDLKYHSTSLHSEQKQFQCEYCGKDFARKYSLIVHRRIHTGEKNYHCEYCSKTFRASSYLQNHRRIHTGEKPHPCTVCGKPFRVRSDMKRHMLTHSRGKIERSLNKNDEKIDQVTSHQSKSRVSVMISDLKLEVDPNDPIVELVDSEVNTESILPHEPGQTVEFIVGNHPSPEGNDRDPLESIDYTLYY